MRRFVENDDGVVAVIFALMAIPFIALGGWAVDYIRLQHVHDHLQAQADTAALSYWIEDAPVDQWRAVLLGELEREYRGDWAREVEATSDDLGDGRVRITIRANVPLSFMPLIPGIPDTQAVTASAVALLTEPTEVREPPINTTLDPEAGDFNRIWMYCYWPSRDTPGSTLPARTQMVPIADNGGSEFTADAGAGDDLAPPPVDWQLRTEYDNLVASSPQGIDGREQGIWRRTDGGGNNASNRRYRYLMPMCSAGSYLSFRLENVRFSRTQPGYWDNGSAPNYGGDKHTGRFDYYTDTYFTVGDSLERYADLRHPTTGQPVNIVETVLCDSLEVCHSNQGGVIPSGRNREPQRASEPCEPGKYMYYGWEDRPPGQAGASGSWQDFAWTDRDFDDIRVVIKCPTFRTEGERNARLVG